jgi:hypothetical protein
MAAPICCDALASIVALVFGVVLAYLAAVGGVGEGASNKTAVAWHGAVAFNESSRVGGRIAR